MVQYVIAYSTSGPEDVTEYYVEDKFKTLGTRKLMNEEWFNNMIEFRRQFVWEKEDKFGLGIPYDSEALRELMRDNNVECMGKEKIKIELDAIEQ